jgi:hypothetical protein
VLGPDALREEGWGRLVSDLPGLKSGGRDGGDPAQPGRRAGARPAARAALDKGVPVLRASLPRSAEPRRSCIMNFAPDRRAGFLREARRGAPSAALRRRGGARGARGRPLPPTSGRPPARRAGPAAHLRRARRRRPRADRRMLRPSSHLRPGLASRATARPRAPASFWTARRAEGDDAPCTRRSRSASSARASLPPGRRPTSSRPGRWRPRRACAAAPRRRSAPTGR